jgi:hypothetical protein
MTRQACIIRGVVFTLTVSLAGLADAAITGTYVDATIDNPTTGQVGNTTPAGAIRSPYFSDADNLWTLREFTTGAVEGGTLFEANGPSNTPFSEDVPLITTTAQMVPAGLYDVYVIYHSPANSNWGVRAGISGGTLGTYNASNGTPTGAVGAGITEYQAFLGTVASNGTIAVDIQDLDVDPNPNSEDRRSWYDGISYQVVPEPSAAAVCLLAVGAFGVRRRNRSRD